MKSLMELGKLVSLTFWYLPALLAPSRRKVNLLWTKRDGLRSAEFNMGRRPRIAGPGPYLLFCQTEILLPNSVGLGQRRVRVNAAPSATRGTKVPRNTR